MSHVVDVAVPCDSSSMLKYTKIQTGISLFCLFFSISFLHSKDRIKVAEQWNASESNQVWEGTSLNDQD